MKRRELKHATIENHYKGSKRGKKENENHKIAKKQLIRQY